jgi:tRNA pseudouridine38-40 synthase
LTAPSQRWALGIEYDGRAFHGYQVQANRPDTVQQVLEAALSRVADEPLRLFCAGRTDAGVHATSQVVHFDSSARRDAVAWVRGGNSLAPDTVSVRWAVPVPADFHARFSARARRYLYVLAEQPVRSAIGQGFVTHLRGSVDATRMHEAAQALLGEHDFTSFRGAGCQARSATRTLHRLDVRRRGALVLFDVEANAFLLHMVRNLVGTLLCVGDGRQPVPWPAAVLAARDRRAAGVTAPPGGLYLTGVTYDRDYGFDSTVRWPWFLEREPT